MRIRVAFVLAIVSAFFIGGTVANMDLIAEATNGNGDGVWAKLVARVTGLEKQLDGNTVKAVSLEDDNAGHAVGWNPDGGNTFFPIDDPDITPDSTVSITGSAFCIAIMGNAPGSFQVSCTESPSDGAKLNYSVVIPP